MGFRDDPADIGTDEEGKCMAHLRDTVSGTEIFDPSDIRDVLASAGVSYERWDLCRDLDDDASPDEVLAAYRVQLEAVQAEGRYTSRDVIDLRPSIVGLDEMLAKFSSEHWHDEDEVRFIIEGRGLFHINSHRGVLALEVEAGDFLRVPRGTMHWFDLCGDRRLKAIRLFQDKSGWTPHYSESGVDGEFQPLCLGPSHIPLDGVSPAA